MSKHFFNVFFAVCVLFAAYACGSQPREWQLREMNSRVKEAVRADLKPGATFCGIAAECQFDLHYFPGKNNSDNKSLTILYIPGGPGDIVDRDNPSLDSLNILANFIYFDVRGTGFSVIPASNEYDQFLRAKYVVEDIELLRKKVLDGCSIEMSTSSLGRVAWGESPEIKCKKGSPKAWDAIYAHSWGTIIAQRYAATYPDNVKKLILSAPVSRAHGETEQARRKMIVENLINIYQRQRPEGCPWPPDHVLLDPDKLLAPDYLPETDNFCFVDKSQQASIRRELTSLLYNIENDYGSTTFVGSFYDELVRDEPGFKQKYPYPEEFYKALRQLELLGAGERPPLKFDQFTMRMKMSAAFFLGYYLMLPKDILRDPTHPKYPDRTQFVCDLEAPFLRTLPRTEDDILRQNFCKRIAGARAGLQLQRSSNESSRARNVFGVYDGITRWIFGMMKQLQRLDKDGCFRGKDLQDVAMGEISTNAVVQKQAAKFGTLRSEKICPWDPASYSHAKPTLMLTADADAVTAGGQARYFFENGLVAEERVLIEFPGAGHTMLLQADPKAAESLAQQLSFLVYVFLSESIDEFILDDEVTTVVSALGAKLIAR